jgi:hypothetical protein
LTNLPVVWSEEELARRKKQKEDKEEEKAKAGVKAVVSVDLGTTHVGQ